MSRPLMLDLFCGAGGCAAGYHAAGFDVVGVDINPQPRYPFRFVQGDALEYLAAYGGEFDAIHASPPCQHYAPVTRWRGDADHHPDMISQARELLTRVGRPWVIENVFHAPLRGAVLLCGTMFGLRIRRHRLFESSLLLFAPMPCRHSADDLPFMHKGERAFADAMGCKWMTNREGRQAIPPACTEFIGRQILRTLEQS